MAGYTVLREVGLEVAEYKGIEVSGYLDFGSAGESVILGVYKKKDAKPSGLWMYTGREEVFNEFSKGAPALAPSSRDFEGSWCVKAPQLGGIEPREYPMTLEKDGDAYKAVAEFEVGESVEGDGSQHRA